MVRIPGVRSKVVVESYEPSIDPVSICVGVKGLRIAGIRKELSGEYVDFIKYTNDFETALVRAFGVQGIKNIKKINNNVFVYIDPEFISNSIGKDGSNINLVRMLFPNYFIDVLRYNEKSEDGTGTKVESLAKKFGNEIVDIIKNNGFSVLEEIIDINREEFKKKTNLDKDVIDSIYNSIENVKK